MPRAVNHPGRVLLAVTLAAGLNFVPIELPGGARFLLGPYVYMPLVLVLGGPWGVLAAAVAMTVTIPVLAHPFAFLIATAEAVWLVWAGRRWPRAALLQDFIFWILGAFVLVPWLYGRVGALPDDLTVIVALKQALNNFSAVAVAILFLRHTNLAGWLDDRQVPRRRVRDIVLHSTVVLSLVPLALVGIGISMLVHAYGEREDREELTTTGQQLSHHLDLFFNLHESAVASLARTMSRGGGDPAALLEETRRAYPAFITMLVADADGNITHAATADALARTPAMNVSDREYFRRARDADRTFVSGVFRGRGFGRHVIVAISAPLHDANGAFAGVVEASLEVQEFAESVVGRRESREIELLFADKSGRVIYADAATHIQPLSSLRHQPHGELLRPDRARHRLEFDRTTGSGGGQRLIAFASRAARSGVVVIAQRPLLSAFEGSGFLFVLFGGVAAGILGAATWVAHGVRKTTSAPLEYFAASADEQSAREDVQPIADPFPDAPNEVGSVFSAFNRLAERLNRSLAMLRQSTERLRRTNDELDRRVIERTAEAEAARQQAEAANRSKTDFLAMTGHEIRTPLNAIIGLAEAVADDIAVPLARERLNTIRSSGRRLLTVVNDLLDLSRAEAGKLELRPGPVELGALCEQVRALFALRAQQQGIGLLVECGASLPCWIETDGDRLQQVLVNLVGNALKFTRAGRIRLSVSRESETPETMALRFAIIDTGPGIAPAEQARLFQPYVQLSTTARSGVPGSGLGLSISRRLVDLFGGTLAVRSAPGEGAEFHFTLPTRRIPGPGAVSSFERPMDPLPRLRVLAADDNEANREVLLSLLEHRCERLVIVEGGVAALAALGREEFDVALIDLEMPDLGGAAVAAAVRAGRAGADARTCRLIACSGHARRDMWPSCAAAGFDDFVEKPIRREALLFALQAAATADAAA